MTAREKLLDKMRRNPRAYWKIADLQAIARHFGIAWRSPGGSHVVFVMADGTTVAVPARRPIKPVYVKMFVEAIDRNRSAK
jgi:hypothetical protein